jgi:hypothetical protein
MILPHAHIPVLKPIILVTTLLGAQLGLISHAIADTEVENSDVTELSTISVTGTQQQGAKISTKKLLQVPGSGGDPLKAIEALPGVILGGSGPFSVPAIRGSNPRDNIYITDFVPVGYVFHNDGNSTYNDNLIEDFSLKAGAWDAQYNNAIGAVLATKLRDPYIEPMHTTVDISLLRAGVLVEGAISEDSAFYASYRQSLLEFYVENIIDEDELVFTEVPKNSDYQLKYQWNISGSSNLRVIATGANDSVGIEFGPESKSLAAEPALAGGLDAETYYHNQAIIYDTVLPGGIGTIVSLSRKEEDVSFGIGTLFELDAVNYETRLKNHYNMPLNNGDSVRFGLDLSATDIDYTASGLYSGPCNADTQDPCAPSSLGEQFNSKDSLSINGAYSFIAYDWLATPNLEVTLGLGNSYNDFNDDQLLQPRISSSYAIADDWTLTTSVGVHDQFIREFRFITKDIGNPDLKAPESTHYIAGLEHQFDDSLSAKIEVYYKDIDNLIVENPETSDADVSDFINGTATSDTPVPYINGSTGKAYGLELLINKNLTDKWYGWLSAAYSKSTRTTDSTGIETDYGLDRPWVINLVAAYQKTDKTSYGFKWRYQSGSLVTPILSANPVDQYGDPSTDAAAYLYVPIYGDTNSERLPAYHRLDFRMDHKLTRRSTFYFEVINLYNQENVSDYEYNRDYTEKEEVKSLPIIFSLGAKLVF